MIELEQALDILQKNIQTKTDYITQDILKATGMITTEDIFAPISVPHFPKSGMDGYAVRSKDIQKASINTPIKLSVLGEICAGDSTHIIAQPNTAVRIMTGGKIPEGYDCVVKQEDSDYGEKTVSIFTALSSFKNYCKIGEDIEKDSCIIPKNTYLTATHIGLLASLGIDKIKVLKPLCVGIISTGNELIDLHHPIGEVGVYPSSAYTFSAILQENKIDVKFIKLCPDNPNNLIQLIEQHIDSVDILLTTGALSVGKKDFLPTALKQLGAKTLFQMVRIRPGTPVMTSLYKNKIILSMSGYPFAAMVNFQIFFWPIVAKLIGNEQLNWKKIPLPIVSGTIQENSIRRFLSAYIDEKGVHILNKRDYSSALSSALYSNCLVDIPSGHSFKPGDIVNIIHKNIV